MKDNSVGVLELVDVLRLVKEATSDLQISLLRKSSTGSVSDITVPRSILDDAIELRGAIVELCDKLNNQI